MRKKKKFNEFIIKTIEELKEEKRYSTACLLYTSPSPRDS